MNEVLKTIKDRSSIRKYTVEPLTQDQINAIIDAGLQAPTAINKQEIHISVLNGNGTTCKDLDKALKVLRAKTAEDPDKVLNSPVNFYYDAPTVFILSADKEFGFSAIDAGIAVENMALACNALGLGNVIIGMLRMLFNSEEGPELEKRCGFPEGYGYQIALAVGYPDTTKEPHNYSQEKNVTFIED